MEILGLNAFHGDASAALVRDGVFLTCIEEERLNRVKHWAGFPAQAVRAVLADAGSSLGEVAHVGISRNPRAHLLDKVLFTFKRRASLDAVTARLRNQKAVGGIEERLGREFNGTVHNVEHHRAHVASAFFCSPWDEAACVTIDGFGDFLSSLSAVGRGTKIEALDHVMFPHSLGILYTAVTQFLGFPKYGDEYKVMGLASYGQPTLLPKLRPIVNLLDDGRFETDVDWFRHASEGVTMSWDDGEPVIGPLWSEKFSETFGPPRDPQQPIGDREKDLAASLQALYEEAFFHRLRALQKRTGLRRLCLAGGCAMNSVANGKIFQRTDFTDVFIQPAAGDAGTALGAALWVEHEVLGRPRGFVLEHSYWGPRFDDAQVADAVRTLVPDLRADGGERGEYVARRLADQSPNSPTRKA